MSSGDSAVLWDMLDWAGSYVWACDVSEVVNVAMVLSDLSWAMAGDEP